MTGIEKITSVVGMLDGLHQELVQGNKVLIESDDFESVGIYPEDELDVLKTLQDNYKVLSFTYNRPKTEIFAFSEEELSELKQYAVDKELDENYFITKELSSKHYAVELLPSFQEAATKARINSLPKLSYDRQLDNDLWKNRDYNDPNLSNFVTVSFREGLVVISTRGGWPTPIGPNLQYGRAPYNFMQYLFAHKYQTINIHDIQEEVDGCQSKTDLTELVRNCHFDKRLKKIFFERLTKKSVRFKPLMELRGEELRDFENTIINFRTNNEKNRKHQLT